MFDVGSRSHGNPERRFWAGNLGSLRKDPVRALLASAHGGACPIHSIHAVNDIVADSHNVNPAPGIPAEGGNGDFRRLGKDLCLPVFFHRPDIVGPVIPEQVGFVVRRGGIAAIENTSRHAYASFGVAAIGENGRLMPRQSAIGSAPRIALVPFPDLPSVIPALFDYGNLLQAVLPYVPDP